MNAGGAVALNREEVENNISCVPLSVANVLCWPLFTVAGRRQIQRSIQAFKNALKKFPQNLCQLCKLSLFLDSCGSSRWL